MLRHHLMLGLLFLASCLISNSYAVECFWWQVKVRAHEVKEHARNEGKVSSHIRGEHCRERWPSADFYITRIVDDKPEGWEREKEVYKKWTLAEKEELLRILSVIPKKYELENFYFYRSAQSVFRNNPASTHLNSRSITLYDLFFKRPNKNSILVHESSHFHFSRFSESVRDEFLEIAGWKKTVQNGLPGLTPPLELIKSDSSFSPEEDFSNWSEVHFETPETLKSKYPIMFRYFENRYRP